MSLSRSVHYQRFTVHISTHVKIADTTIDSCVQCTVEFHSERVSVLFVFAHFVHNQLQLSYVIFNEIGTVLNWIDDILKEKDTCYNTYINFILLTLGKYSIHVHESI